MIVVDFLAALTMPVLTCAGILTASGVFGEIPGRSWRGLLLAVYSLWASFLLIYLIMFLCDSVAGGATYRTVSRVELALFVFMCVVAIVRIAATKVRVSLLKGADLCVAVRSNVCFWIFLVFLVGYELFVFTYSLVNLPEGEWDAVAIWNMKAKFLFLGGKDWKVLFSPAMMSSHLAYPLMLPFFVAHSWLYMGDISQVHALLAQNLILAALLTSLFVFVTVISNQFLGLVAVSSVMLSRWFTRHASWQYSDLLLGLWILQATFPLFYFYTRGRVMVGSVLLSAVCAGTACLVKNEGCLWMLSYCVFAVVLFVRTRERPLLWAIATAILCFTASRQWLNRFSDFENSLFTSDSLTLEVITSKLLDYGRVETVVKVFVDLIFDFERWGAAPFLFSILTILLILMGLVSARTALVLIVPLFVQLLGYVGVYWLTPYNLAWHLKFSADRLLLHIYPLYFLMIFTILGEAKQKAPRIFGRS